MLRHSFWVLAPRKKATIPGFASDTLARVYRDAVHGKPDAPSSTRAAAADEGAGAASEGPSATMRYTPWHNESEVTSHVGEIGVMSRLAYELRKRDKAMAANGRHVESSEDVHIGEDHDHNHDHGHDHHHSHKRHHPIQRGGGAVRAAGASPFENDTSDGILFGTNPTPGMGGRATAMPDDVISSLEEFHARVRGTGAAPRKERSGGDGGGGRGHRHSGVQKEILSLYRQMLREVRRMRDAEARRELQRYIRSEFDKNAGVSRKHIAKIEWCINTAKRKLEDLQRMSSNTKFSMR